jgi:hypothetical protein
MEVCLHRILVQVVPKKNLSPLFDVVIDFFFLGECLSELFRL